MARLEFNQTSPNLPQRGELIQDGLTEVERDLVLSVVNWQNPQRYNGHFRQIFGRSIIYENPSPDRRIDDVLDGNYSGLQIYGAGGSLEVGLAKGVTILPERIAVNPVDPDNHSEQLSHILQNRAFDEQGRMYAWTRAYAPLYGMDRLEADSRRTNTLRLKAQLDQEGTFGKRVPYVVPEFAAEGVFPDKTDPSGESLRFQVYRVPLMPRFSTQLMDRFLNSELKGIHQYLSEVATSAGRTLRIMHDLDLAYMDCHQGNMSYYQSNKGNALYITDLGGCKDVSGERFKDKYYGMDFLIYLISLNNIISNLTPNLVATKYPGLNPEEQSARLLHSTVSSLIYGYFAEEISEKFKHAPPSEIGMAMSDKAVDLMEVFALGAQSVTDFFPGYKASFMR